MREVWTSAWVSLNFKVAHWSDVGTIPIIPNITVFSGFMYISRCDTTHVAKRLFTPVAHVLRWFVVHGKFYLVHVEQTPLSWPDTNNKPPPPRWRRSSVKDRACFNVCIWDHSLFSLKEGYPWPMYLNGRTRWGWEWRSRRTPKTIALWWEELDLSSSDVSLYDSHGTW